MHSSSPPPSSPPDSAALDTEPFLHRSFRFFRRTPPLPLRTAERFFRRASWRRMMLREPSVRVREAAEERRGEWAYSRPVMVLDVAWNLAFLATGAAVLALSNKEKPCVPLRVWIVGYLLQGVFHSLCVVVEFRRRRRRSALLEGSSPSSHNRGWERWSFNFGSGDFDDVAAEQFLEGEDNRKR